MDKYNVKSSFQKWLLPINLKKLSPEAQLAIKEFDRYNKKNRF